MENEEPLIKHHFACLPYIHLGDVEEIDLGFAKIWNFDRMAETYLPDQALRLQVKKVLNSYKNSYPFGIKGEKKYEPIRGIGVISLGHPTEKEISKEDRQAINDARLIVFCSFIANRNTITFNSNIGHSMASSENYAPVYFTAVIGSKYITEMGGFVVASWHAGIDINENMILRERQIPNPSFDIDTDLFNALVQLRLKKKQVFRRIISAIEVFYESYYNSPEVSHNARILLQASAFEILLDSKTGEGRKEMKAFLKKMATYPEDKQINFTSERINKVVQETGTIKEKWADRFFSLRNHIIHGHVPKENEYYFNKWQRHFDIALYFFIFTLKRKLEEKLNKELFGDDVVWKTWEDDHQVPPKRFVGFEYDRIGRRGWERMLVQHRKNKTN